MTDHHYRPQVRETTSRQKQLAQAAATLHLDWENLEVLSQQVHLPATARLLAEVVAAKLDPTASEMALDLLAQLGRGQDYPSISRLTTTAQASQPDYEEIVDLENGFLFTPLYRQAPPSPKQSDPWWDDQAAIEQVCQVWGEYNYPPALTHLIEKKGWTARSATTTTEVRLLTALLVGQTSRVTTELSGNPLALQLLVELAGSYWEHILPQGKLQTMAPLHSSSVETLLENMPRLAEAAYQYVQEQLPPAALPALALLWSKQRQPYLLEVLKHYQYLPSQPPYVGVLVTLASNEQEFLSYEGSWIVAPLVRCLSDRDHQIAERAAGVLAALKNKEAIDTLCQLLCEEDVPAQVQSIAKEAPYLPTTLVARAFYLFMTGQWTAYEGLDFPNFELLTALYATTTPRLRRRIAAQVRRSGNSQYVTIVASQANSAPSRPLSSAPSPTSAQDKVGTASGQIATSATGAVVRPLTSSTVTTKTGVSPRQLQLELDLLTLNQQWEPLWQRVFKWPVAYAVKALLKLSAVGWQPASLSQVRAIAAIDEVDREPTSEDNRMFQQLEELATQLTTPQARENGFSQLGADQWLPPACPATTLELASLLGRSQLAGLVFVDLPGSEGAGAGLVLAAGRKLVIYDHLKEQPVKVVAKASPARIEQLLYLPLPTEASNQTNKKETGWLVWTDEAGVLWGSSLAELMAATTSFKPQRLGQHFYPVKALFAPLDRASGREPTLGRADDYLSTYPYRARVQWCSLQSSGRLTVWQWATDRGEIIHHEIDLPGNWERASEVVWTISPDGHHLVVAPPRERFVVVVDLQSLAVLTNLPGPPLRAGVSTSPFSTDSSNSASTVSALAFTPDGHTLVAVSSAPAAVGRRPAAAHNNPSLELFEMDWAAWLELATPTTFVQADPGPLASQPTYFRPLALPALVWESEADQSVQGSRPTSDKPSPPFSQGQPTYWLQLYKEPAGDILAVLANGPAGYISFIELKSGLELGRLPTSFSRLVWSGSGRYLATLETRLLENSNRRGRGKQRSEATTSGETSPPPAEQKAVIRVWDSSIVHLKELLFERGPVVADIVSLAGLSLVLETMKEEEQAKQSLALPSGLQTALRWLQLTLPYKFRHLIEVELPSPEEPQEFDIELA